MYLFETNKNIDPSQWLSLSQDHQPNLGQQHKVLNGDLFSHLGLTVDAQ
jgi:hypothetical protein